MFGDPVGHASTSRIPDPISRTEANTEVTSKWPSAEDSNKVSVTKSEVESANHRHWQAVLRDPGFLEEAFTHSTWVMRTSELIEMGLLEPQTSI